MAPRPRVRVNQALTHTNDYGAAQCMRSLAHRSGHCSYTTHTSYCHEHTMSQPISHIEWFRTASPYIYAHRQKTFVIALGDATLSNAALVGIAGDLTLLHALGVRLVLIHGNTGELQVTSSTKIGAPVLTVENFPQYLAEVGATTQSLLAHLSMGPLSAAIRSSELTAVSGNFVRGKPLGVLEGIDQQQVGAVRSIHAEAINRHLDSQALVIVPPVGYSMSGEAFGLDPTLLAQAVAKELKADKLIYFIDQNGLEDASNRLISEITRTELLPENWPNLAPVLTAAQAITKEGTTRCHLINYQRDGALLEELFTRGGCGTQIVQHRSSTLRPAQPEDISGILALVKPLEAEGVLVKRSRELIESELGNFWVVDQEDTIIACAALYPFDGAGEIACLATDPEYRDLDHGEALLSTLIASAQSQGMANVFVLTTQTAHWFLERGFKQAEVSALPSEKQTLYNWQRNAKVYLRPVITP